MQSRIYPFIKLPVLFDKSDQEQRAQLENLGITTETDVEMGYVSININQIVAYNETDDGLSRVMLCNGLDMNFQIRFRDFEALLINYYSNLNK